MNIYRSTDYGQTFQNQYSKLQSGFRLHRIIYRFPNNKTVSGSQLYIHTYVQYTHTHKHTQVRTAYPTTSSEQKLLK